MVSEHAENTDYCGGVESESGDAQLHHGKVGLDYLGGRKDSGSSVEVMWDERHSKL